MDMRTSQPVEPALSAIVFSMLVIMLVLPAATFFVGYHAGHKAAAAETKESP